MKKVEVYQADNGQLESDPRRAKAHDIEQAFQRIVSSAPGNGMGAKTRVEWMIAMEILGNPELMITHLQEYIEVRNDITNKKLNALNKEKTSGHDD